MKHRPFGGSTADRTINCPAWRRESEGVPRGAASEYAMEGTALHAVMEAIVLGDIPRADIAAKYTDQMVEGYLITSEHVDERILPAFDAWEQLKDCYHIVDWEPEVECSYAKDIGGYADLMAWNAVGDVFVIDWKFGMGIMVDPTNSHQGRFYAMSARKGSVVSDIFKKAVKLYVVIIQPNQRDSATLKTWETTIEAVDEYEKVFLDAVKQAYGDNPKFATGDHCKWCPAAPLCPAKSGQALKVLQMDVEDLAILGESMDLVALMKAWIKQVEAAVFQQLNAGAEVEGWKLVQKRALNHWLNEEDATKALRRKMKGIKNMTTTKILSPAQMLKAAKAMDVEIDLTPLTTKTSSGNTIAPFTDKRNEVPSPDTLAASLAAIS